MNDDLLADLRTEPGARASDDFTGSVMRRLSRPPRRRRRLVPAAAALVLVALAVGTIREHRRAAQDDVAREIVALRREQEVLQREVARLRALRAQGAPVYLGGTEGADYVIHAGSTPAHLPGPLPDDLRRR